MTSRQRGAAILLAACVAGRVLERFDLPFAARPARVAAPSTARGDSAAAPARAAPERAAPADSTPRPHRRAASHPLGPVFVNHASAAALEALPGVGPVLARRIVDDRVAHGRFRSASDLERVPGIGRRTAARLAPLLRFEATPQDSTSIRVPAGRAG